eukprot:Colp12_sorted_trinity150504_noHs@21335
MVVRIKEEPIVHEYDNQHGLEDLLLENQKKVAEDTLKPVAIQPTPEFCIKTLSKTEEKVFVNVCSAVEVPCPPLVDDVELERIIETGDNVKFRVPVSIGEPHAEIDNGGKGCTVYDAVFNKSLVDASQERPVLKGFLIELAFQYIETKHDLLLSREYRIMKRKCLGKPQETYIRSKSKPFILEVPTPSEQPEEGFISTKSPKIETIHVERKVIEEKKAKVEQRAVPGKVPAFKTDLEPQEGWPEFIVMEIQLPGLRRASSIELDMTPFRIRLRTHAPVFMLDHEISHPVDLEECGCQFDKSSGILTLTMPVLPAPEAWSTESASDKVVETTGV